MDDEEMFGRTGLRPGDPVEYLAGPKLTWSAGTLGWWHDAARAVVRTASGGAVYRRLSSLRRPGGAPCSAASSSE